MEKTEKKPQFVVIRKGTKEEKELKTHEASSHEHKTHEPKPQNKPQNIGPSTTPKLENKKKGPFSLFFGKKITIQAAKSGVLYMGEFIDYIDGFLILQNAKILGTKHIVEVDNLIVNRSQIAHVHTEPKSIEEKNNP